MTEAQLVEFATEVLDQFWLDRCPHCEGELWSWSEYLDPEVIKTFVKSKGDL